MVHDRGSATLSKPREVRLISPAGDVRVARLTVRSGAGKRIIGRIDGVDTPEAAQALMGWRIEVDREALPPTAPGEYYIHDLLGIKVIEDGQEVGTVEDVVTGVRDVWVIATPEGEGWIVASPEHILGVDLVAGIVRVAPGCIERG